MKNLKISLLGNPNSGKTTIFNALTGSHQRIGNWPGVTVEKKSGFFVKQNYTVEVIDLPGIYSLTNIDTGAPDEKIAIEYLLSQKNDLIINIVDASNLERNLYLTTQLLEFNIPIILVINMYDLASKKGIFIDTKKLASYLNCTVVSTISNKKIGIEELKNAIIKTCSNSNNYNCCNCPFIKNCEKNNLNELPFFTYPDILKTAINTITKQIVKDGAAKINATFMAIRLLEGENIANQKLSTVAINIIKNQQEIIKNDTKHDLDVILASMRYEIINKIITRSITIQTKKKCFSNLIDKIVLHKFFSLPIFLFLMYIMFILAINIGGAFQDFFNISSNTIFVDGFAKILAYLHTPNWLTALLTVGIGRGINTTITFIPVIGTMFLILSFLEDCGYMARAAFIVDRIMIKLGLPGKAFIPMIIGFGCNVPAILGTRTLENKNDRILTSLMIPFMSCGARLAIYAIIVAAFFPNGGQNIVFSLYLIGICAAILTGFILRKTLLKNKSSFLLMELPPYHLPNLKNLLRHTWFRLKDFIIKAGKIIVPVCIILGFLNSITINGKFVAHTNKNSLLAQTGHIITPIFKPIGLTQNNWQATVGLLTGVMAKEVVVGTLNSLYVAKQNTNEFNFIASLKSAALSVPNNLLAIKNSFGNPVLASAPIENNISDTAYGQMHKKFKNVSSVFAYLLFILLYFPCIATFAAISRELNWRWALFSGIWTTYIAYISATLFYQIANFQTNPLYSTSWIFGILLSFAIFITMLKFCHKREWLN